MEHTLGKIIVKAGDYKICKECNLINWYENETCHNCNTKDFTEIMSKELMEQFAEKEYRFWKAEGYTEEEADEMIVEI